MANYSIEGPSFSGKSTLARRLAEESDISIVDGYTKYAALTYEGILPPPPTNLEEARKGFDFFVRLERQRSADIRQFTQDGRIVLSDKSALSLVGYQVALERAKRQSSDHCVLAADYALGAMQTEVARGNIAMPEKVVLMSVANESIHDERVQRRGRIALNDIFNHWEFSIDTVEALRDVSSLLVPSAPVCEIASFNGANALHQNVRDVWAFFGLPSINV